MDSSTVYLLCAVIAVSSLVIGCFLFVTMRDHARLRRAHQELVTVVSRQAQDLAALCAAGVNVDRLLADHSQRLRDCLERIETLQVNGTNGYPYSAAIDKIRRGAAAKDLVAELGLSLSEASLLAHLHGIGGRSVQSGEES